MLPTQEESRAWLSRCLKRVPVYFACMLIGGPWALFTFYVAIDRVLLTRHAVVRFIWQMVVFNGLLILAGAAFIAACTRPAIKPDPSFAPPDARPLRPDDDRPAHYPGGGPSGGGVAGHRRARSAGATAEDDDDDIPLRVLRDSPRIRTPASSQPSSSATPVTPVGDAPSRGPEDAYDDAAAADDEEDHALLPKDDEEQVEAHEPLTAKSGTGGPRWCRKCDAWKPDRTHHCRSCRQCVLKMDHHCPWINNCVGYHNYKYFVLFTTYTAMFALFGAWNSGYEVYRYFVDPPDITPGRHSEAEYDEWEEIHVAFKPVVLMLLVFMGTTMGLALAGLSGYHWYLLLNNRTTLEDMNRLPPAALLDSETRATVEALGHRGTRRQQPGAWRPEYILTRGERERLREEARNINVYDVGWRNNVRAVLVGETVPAPQTWAGKVWYGVRALNPLAPPRQKRHGAGHFFPHNPASLAQLRSLTREMRVGQHEPPSASRNAGAYAGGGQWTLGDDSSDSMSDSSDSDRTLYGEAYGERRRGHYDA